MKIGIISLYYKNHNYGGLLQCYALTNYLKQLGFEAEQVTYDRFVSRPIGKKFQSVEFAEIPQKMVGKLVNRTIEVLSKIQNRLYVKDAIAGREEKYQQFEESIPHSVKIYNVNNIEEACVYYDAFICGSDVVWSGAIDEYVAALGFAKKPKIKISYAASLGGTKPDHQWFDTYGRYLADLKYISVREKKIEEKLNSKGYNARNDVDPVMLLNSDDWNKISTKPNIQCKYAFAYLLGDSIKAREVIREYCKREELTLVTIPYCNNGKYRKCDKNFGDKWIKAAGPSDFLGLIKGAQIVFTDSFHATVFSLIFEKEFYSFRRIDNGIDYSLRVQNLLNWMELDIRLLSPGETGIHENSIDFSSVKLKIEDGRTKAKDYLKNSLSIE